MSRVGKMPVAVPEGVTVEIKQDQINVKGKGGALSLAVSALVKIEQKDGKLSVSPIDESREANALSGTFRQLVNNMVVGVTQGFEKKLNLVGVGYKAAAQGAKLNLAVGYSHPVNIDMPVGITVATPTPTEIVVKGADRQAVGQVDDLVVKGVERHVFGVAARVQVHRMGHIAGQKQLTDEIRAFHSILHGILRPTFARSRRRCPERRTGCS